MKNYKDKFDQFCHEVKDIEDAKNAKYEMVEKSSNIVRFSGEILGEDTRDRIQAIGKKIGLILLADGLFVMYRKPGPSFIVK